MHEVTQILNQIEQGENGASEKLLPLVYDELRRLAANRMSDEPSGQTLQATALVHEAYLRLVDVEIPQSWNSRGHFFGAAAQAMRRILVEQARRKKSLKHGGELQPVPIDVIEPANLESDVDLIALDEIFTEFEEQDSESAQVVKLRFFAGLTIQETAEALGISVRSVNRDWVYAKAWLLKRLSEVEAENTNNSGTKSS